MVCRSCKF